MLFVEPEVDCFRLHLRSVRIPASVLAITPDTIANSARPNAAADAPAAHVAPPSASPETATRPSATVSASTRTSGATTAAVDATLSPSVSSPPSPSPPSLATLAERADVIHRALLSTLYARFPYELPDTLAHAYVLVITHHAAPSFADQPLTAEELSCLTRHNDFLPAELRCRTFPSHLNAVLDPAWTAATAAAAAAGAGGAAPAASSAPPHTATNAEGGKEGGEPRPSIRVTDDAAQARSAAQQRSAEAATAAVLHNVPMAPRFYDSFFLLARDLTPAQQALYYKTQCRGRAVPAAALRRDADSGSAAGSQGAETFGVLQGHFTHFVPGKAGDDGAAMQPVQTATSAGPSALAAAAKRMSGGSHGCNAGESETFRIPSAPRTDTPQATTATNAAAAATPTTTAATAAASDVRALHFSIYRIPLTRFQPEEQQYYTDQREELRWRQRRQCRASYRRQRRDQAHSSEGGGGGDGNAARRWWWPLQTGSKCSISAQSSDSSDSSASDGESSDDNDDDDGGALFNSAVDQLLQAEARGVQDGGAVECATTAEQRSAAKFFETCHRVLTNYALAHVAHEGVDKNNDSNTAAEVAPPKATTPSLTAVRRFAGVSFLGVTRLLYSLAPCDCYHLVMRDNNPLYYAHSSRASYQPQTVPLSLVSDLTAEATAAARWRGSTAMAAATAARIIAPAAPHRETVLQRTSGGGPRNSTNDAAAAAAATAADGRPSPTPDISGKVLWLPTEPPLPAAAASTPAPQRDESGDGNHRETAQQQPPPLLRQSSSGPPTRVSQGGGKTQTMTGGRSHGESGLVRSRQPSPDRAGGSRRPSGRHDAAGRLSAAAAASTDGTLHVTVSLVSNSISGNPRRTERSLAEKGARVPDFLLPDAARQRGPTTSAAAAASAAGGDGVAMTANQHSEASTAVVNLFRALSESSLAQHKLRYGSIRPVLSVAVLDSSRYLSGEQRCDTREATVMEQSARYCCRSLVDHTWMSLPVQHTPAEQEAIQWMPVMLGATECVSDVGLRTAVHLGIFPPSTPDVQLRGIPTECGSPCRDGDGSGSGGVDGVGHTTKSGVWPTREGAMASLAPSLRHTARKAAEVDTVPEPAAAATTTMARDARPLQARTVNSVPSTSTAPGSSQGSAAATAQHDCTQQQQQKEAAEKENQRSSSSPVPLKPAFPTVTAADNRPARAQPIARDPDGYAVPTSVVQRRGGVSLQFDVGQDTATRQSHATPHHSKETSGGGLLRRTKGTEDAPSLPPTQLASPRFSHVAVDPRSYRAEASTDSRPSSLPSSWTRLNLGPEEDEDVPVDVANEEAPAAASAAAATTAATEVQHARGGVAMVVDARPAVSSAPRAPATVLVRLPSRSRARSQSAGPHAPARPVGQGCNEEAEERNGVVHTPRPPRAVTPPHPPCAVNVSVCATPRAGAPTPSPALSRHNAPEDAAGLRSPGVETIDTESRQYNNNDVDMRDAEDDGEAEEFVSNTSEDEIDNSFRADEEQQDHTLHPARAAVGPSQKHQDAARQRSAAAAEATAQRMYNAAFRSRPSAAGVAASTRRAPPVLANPFGHGISFGTSAACTPPRPSPPAACASALHNPTAGTQAEPFFDDPMGLSRLAVQRLSEQLAAGGHTSSGPAPAVAAAAGTSTRQRYAPPAPSPRQVDSVRRWSGAVSMPALSATPTFRQGSYAAGGGPPSSSAPSAGDAQRGDRGGHSPEARPMPTYPARHPEGAAARRTDTHDAAPASPRFDTPGNGASRPADAASRTRGGRPPTYFQNVWNAAAVTPTPPRPTFDASPAGRRATTLELSPNATREGTYTPRTPQRTAVRRTLGVGCVPSAAAHTAAAGGGRPLRCALYPDEYDDEAVGGQRPPGVAPRVRPRRAGAVDGAWWQPTDEMAAAPNLRLSNAWGRASVNVRLSGSTDQRYNVDAADGHSPQAAPTAYHQYQYQQQQQQQRVLPVTAARERSPVPTSRLASRMTSSFRPSDSLLANRLSTMTASVLESSGPDYLCRVEAPSFHTYNASPPQCRVRGHHAPFALRRTRVSSGGAGSSCDAILGRRPPLAPPPLSSFSSQGHRTSPPRVYSAAPGQHQRQQQRQRQRRLSFFQQHLQDNYVCGPCPKRFCSELPPTHPVDATRAAANSRSSATGAASLRGRSPGGQRPPCGGSTAGSGRGPRRDGQSGRAHAADGTTRCGTPPPWPPCTTAVSPPPPPPCRPADDHTDALAHREAAAAASPSCGCPAQGQSSNNAPTVATAAATAVNTAQQAEARLRRLADQQEHMRVRTEMEALIDGEAAARLCGGVNVSFTLRDIAAVFLRLPNTRVAATSPVASSAARSHAVVGDAGGVVEVQDVCQAAWRTQGISCFLSRRPRQLRGGWDSYLERLNLYQEPFHLRDQAFVLLLPVPHTPELKVCVAIHNLDDLVALVCQTPVPRIVPTAEEAWVRQRRYGWAGDDEDDGEGTREGRGAAAGGAGAAAASAVAVEERRWLFGLFTTRKIIHVPQSTQHGAPSAKPAAAAAGGDAARRGKGRATQRQPQVHGLCLTWRHRARIQWAFFQASRTCLSLPHCTSPLLTDPAACAARCALLCDRIAAYAAVRHRLETLKAIRAAYVEQRAEELARQQVPKLCAVPVYKPAVQLGATPGVPRRDEGESASWGVGGTARHDQTHVPPGVHTRTRSGGIAFGVDTRAFEAPPPPQPFSAWRALHGRTAAPRTTTLRFDTAARRTSTRAARYRHSAHAPSASTAANATNNADASIYIDSPWRASCASARGVPPPTASHRHHTTSSLHHPSEMHAPADRTTRAMRLRQRANQRVADGVASVESLRHTTRASATSTASGRPSLLPSTLFPGAAAAASSTVAPYASSASLAPSLASRTPQHQQQQQMRQGNPENLGQSDTPLAVAVAASERAELVRRIDRDDSLAAALARLTEVRTAALVPPLQVALAVVPRAAQPARGAGAGLVDGDGGLVPTAGNTEVAASPLYAGFVPTPVEVQQSQAQPLNLSIAQVQLLLRWQWEHHQHSYTLLPLPLPRSTVVPSADFTLFASTSSSSSSSSRAGAHSARHAVSPLARELMLHLARWAWLLPVDSRPRGASPLVPQLRRWRLLLQLIGVVLVLQHPLRSLVVAITVAAALCVLSSLATGMAVRWPRLRLVSLPRLLWGGTTGHRRHRSRAAFRRLPFLRTPDNVRVPSIHERVSLLHRLSETTSQGVWERRRGDSVSHALVTRVLRWQSGAAALLSRLQLFFCGYSVVLSLWVALLCVSYLGLYVAYAGVLAWLRGGCVAVQDSGFSFISAFVVKAGRETATAPREMPTTVLRDVWASTPTGSPSSSSSWSAAATFPAAGGSFLWSLLQPLAGTAWSVATRSVWGALRPHEGTAASAVRVVQRHDDAVSHPADNAEAATTEGHELGNNDEAEGVAHATGGQPSYFYQNGRYYTYTEEPPAWARGSSATQNTAAAAPSPAVSQPAEKQASVGEADVGRYTPTPMPPPPAAPAAAKVPEVTGFGRRWFSFGWGGGSAAVIPSTAATGSRGAPELSGTAEGVAGGTNGSSTLTGARDAASNASARVAVAEAPARTLPYAASFDAEPSLLWFFVLAYVVTVCIPHSPFRWLWRRVWQVLINDDALVRCPLLSV